MSTNIVNIALLGMSEKTSTTFNYFIRKQAYHHVKLSKAEQADVYITDFDNETGISDWHTYCRSTNKPSIILSVENPNKPNTIWIKKPVISSALLSAIPKLTQLSLNPKKTSSDAKQRLIKAAEPISVGNERKTSTGYKRQFADDFSPNLSLSKEEIIESCGSREDITLDDPNYPRVATYNEKTSLLNSLKQAIELAAEKQAVIYLEGLPFEIAVIPNEGRISVDLNNRHLRHICAMPLSVMPRLKVAKLSVKDYRSTFPIAVKHMPSNEEVIWQIALWSARGRLTQAVNPQAKLSLPAWPNFTRLQITPYAIQIAALWTQHSMTVDEVSSSLQVPQRYVYAIASASHAIGLLREEKAAFGMGKIDWKPKNSLFNSILRSLRIA